MIDDILWCLRAADWWRCLWLIHLAAVAVIFVAGIRVLVERSRGAPLWVRLSVAGMVGGALFSVERPSAVVDPAHVLMTAGLAGTLLFRIMRKSTARPA